eukprot:3300050-Prymnesium_polylepis.1
MVGAVVVADSPCGTAHRLGVMVVRAIPCARVLRRGGEGAEQEDRRGDAHDRVRNLSCAEGDNGWPMADVVARGGIGSLRTPCGASWYVSMRGLIGSRRVPST